MIAAIYSRKSKFTTKGNSVENQIQLCKEYGNRYGITEFRIYEDEGFSGKSTDRPEFQRMIKDSKSHKFEILICYKLDRISRNIADFSSLIDQLQKLGINFVSITEQFDTTTPMGRAMMNIAAVFAQLERETIAERIRDNMLELSKTGRWLGGTLPFGFSSQRIVENGKEVTYLIPKYDELDIVKLIYDKYFELGSLFKVNKYLINNNIAGRSWTSSKVSQILQNPVYCISNEYVKEYLELNNVTVVGEMNGNGFIAYNKTDGNRRLKDMSEWVYAIARHEGIVNGDVWVKVQKQLKHNMQFKNTGKSKAVLLTGLLRCAKCKSLMEVVYGVTRKDGTRPYYYRCSLKNSSGGEKCNNPNAHASDLEVTIIGKLKKASSNRKAVINEIERFEQNTNKSKSVNELEKIKKAISKNELAIQNLVKQLSLLSQEASGYIISEVERLSKENNMLKNKLIEVEDKKVQEDAKKINTDLFIDTFLNFGTAIDQADTPEKKRALITQILSEITWDGYTGNAEYELIRAE